MKKITLLLVGLFALSLPLTAQSVELLEKKLDLSKKAAQEVYLSRQSVESVRIFYMLIPSAIFTWC